MRSWSKYFEHYKQSPHHAILERAVALQSTSSKTQQKYALDIGCGTGRDTIFLLQQNYQTTSVDPELEALAITTERCREFNLPVPELIQSKLEDLQLVKKYDLISSNLALPFVNPAVFNDSWGKLMQHLEIGGIFSGQFFGVKHDWAKTLDMTFHTGEEINALFRESFNIIALEESLEPIKTISAGIQQWHQWNVIAKKVNI